MSLDIFFIVSYFYRLFIQFCIGPHLGQSPSGENAYEGGTKKLFFVTNVNYFSGGIVAVLQLLS